MRNLNDLSRIARQLNGAVSLSLAPCVRVPTATATIVTPRPADTLPRPTHSPS